jgi:hypothetical protein
MFVVLVCTDDSNYEIRCVAEPTYINDLLNLLSSQFSYSLHHKEDLSSCILLRPPSIWCNLGLNYFTSESNHLLKG